MTYRLLDKIPYSGTAPEYFFGDHQGQVAWLEFNDNSKLWFGVFELGKLPNSKIKIRFLPHHINVLTRGNFYKVNSETKECEFNLTDLYILDFIEVEESQSFIFVEQTGISTYKNNVKIHRQETNFTCYAEIENIKDDIIIMNVDRGDGVETVKINSNN